ncbi:hypothetical protein AALP_AA1G112400 [Arabis alpina]|uniref:Uncharacterized protein n=1 Tax=Arabis alpina TaxID=50452 RepID=A0A087HMI9_ARAAL|nr:hypothetical protein AALP_AA1G112400 [Arabis alpina]
MNSSRSLYNVSVSSLPRRVLAVETIPPGRRLNIYSTPEYLGYIANLLQGTPEWDRLRTSQFGKLFNLPVTRKSFIATIGRFGPPQGSQTPIADLIVRLKQKTSATYGFPLALQLQAFEAIPLLLEKIPNYSDIRGFANRPSQRLSCTVILHQGDVLAAEMDPKLVVSYTLSPLEDNIEDSTIPIEQATKTTETVNVQTLKPPSRKLATRKGNRATTRQTKPQDIDDVAPDGIEGLKKFILEQNGLLFERIMGELDKRIPPREESLSKGNESKRKRVVESKGSKRKKPERQYINITSDSDGDMDPPVE